ncbi:MAG: 5,6-dimethylbenzimidazole synthase [Ferrimicrobium sp.]
MSNAREVLYEIVGRRRDVRAEFLDQPLAPEVLGRLLEAAHQAPSVGMSQPWDFVLVRDRAIRQRFHSHVQEERVRFAESLDDAKRERFAGIKIEGILDAALGVVVTYDPDRGSPSVLGRHSIADAGLYSVCLAIENLWLAATAEEIGVGWVSFYREEVLADLVGLPERVRPIAWLCVGPVSHFEAVPDLERLEWQSRRPLEPHLFLDRWGDQHDVSDIVTLAPHARETLI